MTALIRYEAARSALAEARSFDEVKDVLDKAEALRAYGRMANDLQLEIDAAEIRMRAERRLGIMLDQAKRSGQLREGRPKKAATENGTGEVPFSLADIGVDKKLSARAQKVGGIAERAFEGMVSRLRDKMADGNRRVSLDLIKEDEAEADRERRANRVFTGGTVDDLRALIAEGRKFGAILADPAWHFATRSEKGDGRSAGKHYVTDAGNAMFNLPIEQLAADDCVLFMWMVDWDPKLAIDLIEAWGFEHKTTAFTWVKQTKDADGYAFGQGYWTRANPEQCWLATRGHPKRLHADVRQLVVSPIMEHSKKPEAIHDYIERLVDGPYLELFARRPRDKWQTWGNELAFKTLDIAEHNPETGEIIEADALRATDDDLYPQAIEIVRAHNKASASLVQRKLQLNWNTASALLDRMEAEGLVSPANHAGKRDAYLDKFPAPESIVGEAEANDAERRNSGGDHEEVAPSPLEKNHVIVEAATATGERSPRVDPVVRRVPTDDDIGEIPEHIRRVTLSKNELAILNRISTDDCDKSEQVFILLLRKEPSLATVANQKRLLSIAERQGLMAEEGV